MTQTLLEMAKELVAEQIRQYHISSDEAQALLRDTHATLQTLHRMEVSGSATMKGTPPEAQQPEAWRKSITKHAIICLECGDAFKQLSRRHLSIHDLDARTYRAKHSIPRTQSLSSLAATARRRELAKQIRPWEKAASRRKAAKAAAKKARQS